ncbi:CopG family ribbon-helix-helix protein [Niveispirillum sp. KHB5.9]|uniref:CopG family ribbon-helix-helix protein n=1 Tax=Niveispirillum sp. KHB5.9 TaxID=3400269 RepID=UPI003A894466
MISDVVKSDSSDVGRILMEDRMCYDHHCPNTGRHPMPEGTTLTVRLKPEVEAQLSDLAHRTHRSQDTLVAEAIEAFLSQEGEDVARIEAALIEMETADLIPHERAMDELEAAIEEVIAARGTR